MKYLIFVLLCAPFTVALAQDQPAQDWYLKQPTKKNNGIDVNRSYAELLKDKKAQEIIVAVIDNGTDITHPDLVGNIWHNPLEIPFNNIDDDNNGYVDDTVGWNFIGGADGKMVQYDNLEMTRLYRKLSVEFEDLDAEDISGNEAQVARYTFYQQLKAEVTQNQKINEAQADQLERVVAQLDKVKKATGKDNPSYSDLEKYTPESDGEQGLKELLMKVVKKGTEFVVLYDQIKAGYDQAYTSANYQYNVKFDPRGIVGDNYNNSYERVYGNNNVGGPDPSHGTHVAGIIAAMRGNGIGMDGVADHVKIMVVRVVPDGDERDKDVANGIRYAVDNGAKVINMSFGKGYSWDKGCVDSAVKYAQAKGVLLVHGAGNDHENNDYVANYPNDSLGNGFANNWVEVGASAQSRKNLAASFSNYGKNNVDVFAPGWQIYSTTPNAKYEYYDGTSMASPVVAGVAALVWSYNPKLTAAQLKEVLMKSAMVVKSKVPVAGMGKVKFSDLSVSGGVVNVYNAILMAQKITGS